MSVSIVKNSRVSLAKSSGNPLSRLFIGAGWDPIKKEGGFFSRLLSSDDVDLDLSLVLFDVNGDVIDLVWFQKKKSNCGNVIHSGDNLTGDGDGDDEVIKVNLNGLSENVKAIGVTINSFSSHNFGDVENCYCRVLDQNHKELVKFDLQELHDKKAVFVAAIVRNGDDWEFEAKGAPSNGRTVLDSIPNIKDSF